MNNPEDPLRWPSHFPPTDPVKKFFIGVRWLGPDLHFFKEIRDQQAKRTQALMACWQTDEERKLARLVGKHFQESIGWKTDVFLPLDAFHVIAYGPRFQSIDDLLFAEAVLRIEKEIVMTLPISFWQQVMCETFGDVVRAMLQKQRELIRANNDTERR